MAISTYKPYDYGKAYKEAEKQQRAAEEATYNKTKSNIEFQQGNLGKQYDAQRGNIYSNARLSAIGNNEALAAKGLAGGLYNQPTTGYSESSRIKQNIAMQNSLNAASAQEQQERDKLSQMLIEAAYQRDANLANYLASAGIQRANAESAENQFNANFNFQAAQAAQQAEQYAQEQAYNKAITELNTFGKIMTKESARVLNMPIGTTTFAYQQSLNKSGGTGGVYTGGGGDGKGDGKSKPTAGQIDASVSYILAKASTLKQGDSDISDAGRKQINNLISMYVGRGELDSETANELSKSIGTGEKY